MKKKLMLMAFLCAFATFSAWADDVEGESEAANEQEEKTDFGFVFGYVNKQWTSKIQGSTYRENLWGEEGKRLHGIQLGFTYTPTLPMGLGVYTGLVAEIYFSSSKAMGFDQFTEFSLYVPIHANFKLPLSKDVSLRARGGLGLNYACHGGFTNHDAYYWEWVWDDFFGDYHREKKHYELDHLRYGKDGWPKRFNAALEFSVGIEIKNFVLSGGYSWGLTDHQFYKDVPGSSTHQDKLTISLGYEF